MSQKMNVGGQAIIEGVMMRSPRSFAIAVRRANGQIVVTERAWESLNERFPFLKWPIFRGAVMMVESLFNGIQALMFSADQAMEGLEEEAKGGVKAEALPELAEGQNTLEVADKSARMSSAAVFLTIPGFPGFRLSGFQGHPAPGGHGPGHDPGLQRRRSPLPPDRRWWVQAAPFRGLFGRDFLPAGHQTRFSIPRRRAQVDPRLRKRPPAHGGKRPWFHDLAPRVAARASSSSCFWLRS